MRVAVVLAVSLLAGCGYEAEFDCTTSQQCRRGSANGACQPNGYCAFEDASCTSGLRYDETAGMGLGAVCVGETDPTADAGPDATPLDCPGTYIPIGAQRSRYRVVSMATAWVQGENACEADGQHLIMIDDAGENAAAKALGGNVWIGVFRGADSVFYLISGMPLTGHYTAWAPSYPVSTASPCVAIQDDGWHNEACTLLRPYICECDGIPPVVD